MSYTFSKHAKQRFAQRMQDYNSSIDVNVFIANHNDEIEERITKLIEYSELIYSGKSSSEYNKELVDIYLNKNGWIVIIDHKKNNVITLFNVTLGLDESLDREYLIKVSDKLKELKEKEETALMGIATQEETYSSIIAENKILENELRSQLKALEEQDAAYEDVMKSLHINRSVAEQERRNFIAKMLGRKVF